MRLCVPPPSIPWPCAMIPPPVMIWFPCSMTRRTLFATGPPSPISDWRKWRKKNRPWPIKMSQRACPSKRKVNFRDDEEEFMKDPNAYQGTCFCGAVEITATGSPQVMGYCHCNSCRHWSASPVNAFTLWPPENVKVTKGADQIGVFNKTDNSFRKWCK